MDLKREVAVTYVEASFENTQKDTKPNELAKVLNKTKAHGNSSPATDQNSQVSLSPDSSDDRVGGDFTQDIGDEEDQECHVVSVARQLEIDLHADDFGGCDVGAVDEGEGVGDAEPGEDVDVDFTN